MSDNRNSVVGFYDQDLDSIRNSLGVTQFSDTDASKWAQVINGVIIQGGLASATGAQTFQVPFPQQVLGVFVNGGIASAVTLNGFNSSAASYWWAIGV
jgi:hypothetical protein